MKCKSCGKEVSVQESYRGVCNDCWNESVQYDITGIQ